MLGVFKNEIDWLSLVRPMGGGLRQGDGVMKAVLPLVLTALLGLGSGGAVAQIAPGDPAGNQTIPEKDLSRPAEGARRMETRSLMETKASAINWIKAAVSSSQRKAWTRR